MSCDAIEKRVEVLEEKCKALDDKFIQLDKSDAIRENSQNQIMVQLGKLEAKIDDLASKPSKRWDGAVMAAITAIISFCVGKFL